MTHEDWDNPGQNSFACVIEVAEPDAPHVQASERLMLLFNAGHHSLPYHLPPGRWCNALDSASGLIHAAPFVSSSPWVHGQCELAAKTLKVLVQSLDITRITPSECMPTPFQGANS